MNCRQWEILTTETWGDAHPVVVITPASMLYKEFVNVLACTSKYPTRPAAPHEIILDESDGLDRPTLCKLAPILAVRLDQLRQRRGLVQRERQRQIGRKLIRLFGLYLD